MVRGAFLHLPGIGAIRAARLHALGVRDWSEFGPQPPAGLRLGPASWSALLDEVARCDQALAGGDLGFLAGALRGPDLWRLLAVYSERAAFVDIETDGLHHGARITVIACLWQGRLHTFVQDENLDEFLDLLQHVELLVTFNGASFDIPMIRNGFHIPELPCAHVDLRWVCYHAGWRGGLKAVEGQLGLQRPGDLLGVDGAAAVDLWTCWEQQRSRPHRDLLVRYCAADTVALRGVAGALLKHYGCPCAWPAGDAVWHDLNEALPAPAAAPLRWASTVAAGARVPNATNFLAAPSAADGQVGRGCRYPTPDASLTGDRQSPSAAKQNEDVSGIASTAPPPGPGVTPSPAPGSPRPTCIPRPANTQSAARRRLRELLQRRFAGRRE